MLADFIGPPPREVVQWLINVGLIDVQAFVDLTPATVARQEGGIKLARKPSGPVIPMTERIVTAWTPKMDPDTLALKLGCSPKYLKRTLFERGLAIPGQRRRSRSLIIQATKQGEFIAKFKTFVEASRVTGLTTDTIRRCCRTGRGRHFLWFYEEDWLKK